ncbi:MAG TPA: IS110 family transposase [Streptosporangiaceae bacterium]|nr:IS110 family transposase [Streptosporangiaceae bacterium]
MDPHKSRHTATAVDKDTHQQLGSLRVEASLAGYRRLRSWAKAWPRRRWAIENAHGLGRHLAQWLLAREEGVVDVPTTATRRVRELSRGGRRKNDVIDAAAAASVAALYDDAAPVTVEDTSTVLALLGERRTNLSQQRVRAVNQLHALLRDLLAGGAPTSLTADQAAQLLRAVRPAGPVEQTRKQLARDLITEIRRIDAKIKDNAAQMAEAVTATGSTLTAIDGVGPVTSARILGRTRGASRFATGSHYANYTGTAPIEVASAGRARHRLCRGGDRQLNAALHVIAITQVRMTRSTGRAYYDRKIAEGKTHSEALRCLKRRLAEHLWRTMIKDERRRDRDKHHPEATGPGGHPGATTKSSAAGPTPTADSSDKITSRTRRYRAYARTPDRLTNTEAPCSNTSGCHCGCQRSANAWLAKMFTPHRITQTIADIARVQHDQPNPRILRAKAKIAECDTKLARHRAALEAGADPATVTGWIADTNAQRVAAQAELRAADTQPHKTISPDDIKDMITTLGGLIAILHDARPEDRHSIYSQLGIRMTYHPGKHEIRAEATLHPDLLVAPHDSKFGVTVRDRGGT